MDFTASVETFHVSIFVRSSTTDINSIDDLQGHKVAVVSENKGLFIMQKYGKAELLTTFACYHGERTKVNGPREYRY